MKRLPRTPTRIASLLILGASFVAACGPDSQSQSTDSTPAEEAVTLRLGYFPNVTHAPALVGIHDGIFADSLGSSVTLETSPFNAGPEAIEALFAGAIDATFIGPNPAINAFAKSGGKAIRIVAGTTSGGAFFIVAPEITAIGNLRDKTIATPQLGGTQDVALRSWLLAKGLATDTAQGGDVSVAPQANADTLNAFKQGQIAGAWVPEPWATRLIQEGGGKVFVDERDLWPGGEYVTTHLIVATKFLEKHPAAVRKLIEGLIASMDALAADPVAGQKSANTLIGEVTGKPLSDAVIAAAWKNLKFTVDPVASSLQKSADDAVAVGLLEPVELKGIYDLSILNKVLVQLGREEVVGL